MARQRIGVTSSGGQGVTQPIEKVGRLYLDGIVAAGGLPVVLPALDPSLAADALDGLDGLLLTGGGDVEPARFGAAPHPECGPPEAARDGWELALVPAARTAGIPILGICRGIQVLNVAYGGTLVQHLPGQGIEGHDEEGRAAEEIHGVRVAPGSLVRRVLGADDVRANTLHHQAVDPLGLGRGVEVTGVANDGVIEAIEVPGESVVGVQWHPELLLDRAPHLRLFEWVVDPDRF